MTWRLLKLGSSPSTKLAKHASKKKFARNGGWNWGNMTEQMDQAQMANAVFWDQSEVAPTVPPQSSSESPREKALRQLWHAIENLPEGIALFDEAERLLFCNQSYRDISPAPKPGISDLLYEGGEHRRHITRQLPSGERLSFSFDLSDLHQKIDQAAQANRAKADFLAHISHEIRTPMNGILGMAEHLCAAALPPEQRLYVETIRSSAEALLHMINDFLDHSKLEAQFKQIKHEPIDLERIIYEVVMLLQSRAHAKALDLLIDYDVFLPTRFLGDPGRIRQVLTNLLGNAVKFTDSGHVLIRVVGLEEGGRHQLHITIEDSGCGIPPDEIDNIFGAYQQLKQHSQQGTGLGLAISKGLIEQMGGVIWVDSQLGKGSVFGFKLSMELSQDAEAPRPQVRIKHALVVNPRFLNRRILERQLGQYGIGATLCYDAQDTFEILATGQCFDVAIIDQDLPQMTGSDLAKHLKQKGHNFPIILLSHQGLNDPPADAAVACQLHKPFVRSELYRALHALSQVKTRPMRVLAAEDNKTNQLVLQMMINDLDIDLVFAENGQEALTYWEHFEPDIIFMDISMPVMKGDEATRLIRARESRHTPIIALSAHQDEGQYDGDGFDAYMMKPLRKTAILDVLKRYQPNEARL